MSTIEEILAGDRYNVVDVAKLLSVSVRTVRRLIENGKLESVKISVRNQVVTREQLSDYLIKIGIIRRRLQDKSKTMNVHDFHAKKKSDEN